MASILVKTTVAISFDGELKYKSNIPYVVADTYENKLMADRLVADGLIDIVVPFTAIPPDNWRTMLQGEPEITVEDEDSDVITVSVQLKDVDGRNINTPCVVRFWLTDDPAGDLCAVVPSGGVAAGTKGTIIAEIEKDLHYLITSDNKGVFDVDITEVGAKVLYFNVEYQGYVTSAEVEFAV